MIEKLLIEKFGKFHDQSFEFGPVTLFLGNNEAGKTTLFDALFHAICKPKGSLKDGRRLEARYGADRKAAIQGLLPKIGADDFFNLFAVKSNALAETEISERSDMTARLKANLFSGGVDPKNIAEVLGNELTTRKQGALGAREKELDGKIAGLKSALSKDEAERAECLRGEADAEKRKTGLEVCAKKIMQLETEIARDEGALQVYRAAMELRKIENDIALFDEKRQNEARLAEYDSYTNDGRAKLKALEGEKARLTQEAALAAQAAHDFSSEIEKRLAEKNAEEDKRKRLDKESALAAMLKERLKPKERLIEKKDIRKIRPVTLALALAAFAAGIAAFIFLGEAARIYAALALGAAGIVLTAVSFRTISIEDCSRLESELETARAAWKKETGADIPGVWEDMILSLQAAETAAANAADSYERSLAALREAETKKARLSSEAEKAEARKRDAEEALREALGPLPDAAVYIERLAQKRSLSESLEGIRSKLAPLARERGVESFAELETALKRQERELRDSLVVEAMSDDEARQCKRRLETSKAALTKERVQKETLDRDFNRNEGTFQERFRGLPDRIANNELALKKAEGEREQLARERRATEIARDIFFALSEDSAAMLETLSGEIGRSFAELSGGVSGNAGAGETREVRMDNFSVDSGAVHALDAGGENRAVELLSSGTKDAFYLAARLVLARKSLAAGEKALMIFDEAFTALDSQRIQRALRVIEKFYNDTNWQIVIFTKDKDLETMAARIFGPSLRVNELV